LVGRVVDIPRRHAACHDLGSRDPALFCFGGGSFRRPRWHDSDAQSTRPKDSETAIEILKKRYAKGEINREEFEQIKKDLQS